MNLTNEELLEFFTELQGLVRAGVPLGHELDLRAASDSRRVRRLWSRVEASLKRGERLSEALRGVAPQISDPTLTLIRAGEESGELLGVLEVVAQGHRRRLGLERTLKLAMIYPLVIVIFALGVMMMFGAVIVPAYEGLSMPAARQMFIAGPTPQVTAGSFIRTFVVMRVSMWMVTPPGMVLTGALALLLMWLVSGGLWLRPWVHRHVFAWMPVLGPLMNLGAVGRWCHTVGHLLRHRVSVDTALALAEPTLELRRLEREAALVREQVERGLPLSMAMMARRLMPGACAGLLAQGEERGDVDATLLRLADHFGDRLDHRLRHVEAWLEPTLMLFTGALVFLLIVSLYMPIVLMVRGAGLVF